MSATNTRLLIAAHSHPAITKGGAEIAAWRLYESIGARRGWQAWFMGCARETGAGRAGSVITQPFSDTEFVYTPTAFDWFKFANLDKHYPRELETVLQEVAPDIVHFHHYVNFGVETFLHIKRALPACRIVLTLHEFQAICNHYGQMVTKEKKSLCYEDSPRECNRCFPEFSRSDFFLRKTYISRFFDLVDQFISPSAFPGRPLRALGRAGGEDDGAGERHGARRTGGRLVPRSEDQSPAGRVLRADFVSEGNPRRARCRTDFGG